MNEREEVLENLLQEMRRGTLVLNVLLSTGEPVYGYSLVSRLHDAGVSIEQNTLYPLLRRLEKQNLLKSSWVIAEARPRRYYQISSEGKQIRDKLLKEWKTMNSVITRLENDKEEGL
ncbi:MAG: PadR family transcriptional regulator [Fibrobacter sp.]|nr:PadR family transcriptional regulator [Fibrobacter sp.]